jgi:hypothetical protein
MKYVATVDGRDFEIDVDRHGEVVVDGERFDVDLQLVDGVSLYSLIVDHASHELIVERRGAGYTVFMEGDRYVVDVDDARLKQLKAMGGQQHEEHGVHGRQGARRRGRQRGARPGSRDPRGHEDGERAAQPEGRRREVGHGRAGLNRQPR